MSERSELQQHGAFLAAQRRSALEIRNLSKTFSGQVVLDGVSMSVAEAEVHALVGQNGSGKSTLIKVLAGYHQPDDGASAAVHGDPLELGSAADAHHRNIRFVHQDLGLVGDLSVTENIMLGRKYPRRWGGAIDWRAARALARDVIARTGQYLDVRRPVGELGIAERTRVAIARALPENDDPSIIVLDEPTAALPARDVEQLFGTIRRLTEAGNAVVLVSHHLDEILGISDSVTVLRDGSRVATVATNEVDHDSLVRLIIGRELVRGSGRSEAIAASGTPVLRVSNVSGDSVLDFTAELHPGEIVGVVGLTGSGRELVAGMLTGRLPRHGSISLGNTVVPARQPKAALDAGMAWICGERARYGTFANMDVRSNLTMGDLKRHTRGGRIDQRSERAEVRDWIDQLSIVTRGPDAPITSLSGGNQQKVLVARALRLFPRVLVLDDPTAGIDVGAREQVHAIVEKNTTESMSVLLVSTDSDELARLCDRVLVMVRGVVADELRRGVDLTAENIDHAQVAGAAA
jgi:ribose transport system ATP-binding protein